MDHNASTCEVVKRAAEAVEKRKDVASAYQRSKKKAKLVSRLKYTNIKLRSAAYRRRPLKRTRARSAANSRNFLELARMPAVDLVKWLHSTNLLQPLEGQQCRCGGNIGRLCHRKRGTDFDIHSNNVWNRCQDS